MSILKRRFACVCMVFALVAGCGDSSDLAIYPVKGTVLYRGKPVPEAQVVFHPEAGTIPDMPHNPIAVTDDQGRFHLTTIDSNDGAPVGNYTVTLQQRESRLVGEEMVRAGRNLLPPRYADPLSSPFHYEVTAATPEIQLELDDKGPSR